MHKVLLNWLRSLWEEDEGVVKRSGRDEPIWVIVHICMEATLEFSLYSSLYLNLAKISCFSYCLFMLFLLLEERK
jgi:hypothetical protein